MFSINITDELGNVAETSLRPAREITDEELPSVLASLASPSFNSLSDGEAEGVMSNAIAKIASIDTMGESAILIIKPPQIFVV
jgi:hypothetical protein